MRAENYFSISGKWVGSPKTGPVSMPHKSHWHWSMCMGWILFIGELCVCVCVLSVVRVFFVYSAKWYNMKFYLLAYTLLHSTLLYSTLLRIVPQTHTSSSFLSEILLPFVSLFPLFIHSFSHFIFDFYSSQRFEAWECSSWSTRECSSDWLRIVQRRCLRSFLRGHVILWHTGIYRYVPKFAAAVIFLSPHFHCAL